MKMYVQVVLGSPSRRSRDDGTRQERGEERRGAQGSLGVIYFAAQFLILKIIYFTFYF